MTKRPPPKVIIQTRVDPKLADWVDKAAYLTRETRSAWLRQLLQRVAGIHKKLNDSVKVGK